MNYQRPSIRHDNRLLAVGSQKGVVLWDLARGTECAFLPIGRTWQVIFDANGDLLTSGWTGVQRWAVKLEADKGDFQLGPPRDLLFPWPSGTSAEDRSGRIIATSDNTFAHIQSAGTLSRVGPLDECRDVAVSPEGEWLATGSQQLGAQVWRIRDAHKEADLPVLIGHHINFSPDGKWLLTGFPPCKLWTTGTWTLARELGGMGLCFSNDSRLLALQDASKVIRLVEVETGRVIAQLEGPDLSDIAWATFSPDDSRLALVCESEGVHVWDLRAIRKQLSAIGLDWHAPAFSGDDPASRSATALPVLRVDLGTLRPDVDALSEAPATLVKKYTSRVIDHPIDAEGYHGRGHALFVLGRVQEAIDDFEVAVRLRPADGHLREFLAYFCGSTARKLVMWRSGSRLPERALALARRAVELAPHAPAYGNTLGIALYRACRYPEAIAALERHLSVFPGEADAWDLYFLAMVHHRQGRRDQARACFERA